jgi:hypothetical protein
MLAFVPYGILLLRDRVVRQLKLRTKYQEVSAVEFNANLYSLSLEHVHGRRLQLNHCLLNG